jgi:hypothetical protein
MFNLDGTLSRKRKKPCVTCGAVEVCDDCWEHERDWSPFVIMHCFICRMPQARFDGGLSAMRCDFCGADEAEFTTKTHHG